MAVVALGVTGGIAAYKSCELVRRLGDAGHEVHVVMTREAMKFVRPLTFEALSGHPVQTSRWTSLGGDIAHIAARRVDAFVIAPCTVNTLAKLSLGLADDVLTNALLAYDGPIIIAPAANPTMMLQRSTVAHLSALRERGATIVGPETGYVACREMGPGRMSEPADIALAVERALFAGPRWTGVRVLVSAGRTEEPIDAVRLIANRSSGRMGLEVALEAHRRGATVTLVMGPSDLTIPAHLDGLHVSRVATAAQMAESVLALADTSDVYIGAAAIADYTLEKPLPFKRKKSQDAWTLTLAPTVDVLAAIGARRRDSQTIVGFALETADGIAHAVEKAQRKRCDLMVLNNPLEEGAGPVTPTNRVDLISPDGRVDAWPMLTKREVAARLCDAIAKLRGIA